MGGSEGTSWRLLLGAAVAAGAVAASLAIAAAPATAAGTISVSASYHHITSQGQIPIALDPSAQTDVTAGNILVALTITNSAAEPYTLASAAPTTPANQCAGTIAPGASLNCFISPTVNPGQGVLDVTLAGSYPSTGPDTTVVSYPYFGVQYTFRSDAFGVQPPPPATGWITTIPDPQIFIYPGLFRPLIRLGLIWDGNTPATITQATGALAAVSTQCFGALPKVVQPGDRIMSCDFPIMPTLRSWGFTYTGAITDPQAYTGFLSYTPGGSCSPTQKSYAGGDTIVINCINFTPGISAQARIWNLGVTGPETVAADGTVSFSYTLPTITTGFPSASLVFREGGDPTVESAGATEFAIDPGTASATAPPTPPRAASASPDAPELADSGSDLSGPLALAIALLGSGLVAVRRRRNSPDGATVHALPAASGH